MAGVGREGMAEEGDEWERKWPPRSPTDREALRGTNGPCQGELPRRKAWACSAH